MKITKKQPLRPRGRSDEKRQSTKDAIREAYANGPQKEVQIIPAKKDLVTDLPRFTVSVHQLRYAEVGTLRRVNAKRKLLGIICQDCKCRPTLQSKCLYH